jgi:hypothetical protein
MALSGEERLKMGSSMQGTARTLVCASVLAKSPEASERSIRRALFLRFYGQDFPVPMQEQILQHLERACART